MKLNICLSCFGLLFLTACASNEPDPIETESFFTSRTSPAGNIEFAFGLAWQSDPFEVQQLRARRGSSSDNRQFGTDRVTKLELEDEAAQSLKQELNKREICLQGHKIDQVIWEHSRIRLMGQCNE